MADTSGEDLNKFELQGNVGHVRVSATPSGLDVANVSIGTHRMVVDSETKAMAERTEWHDVVAFGELARRIGEIIRVGARVYASGYMRTRVWEDRQSGRKSYKHELVATVIDPRERQKSSRQESAPSPSPTPLDDLEIHRLA